MNIYLSCRIGALASHFYCKTRDTQMPGSGQVLPAAYIAESRRIGVESLYFCSTSGFKNAADSAGPGSMSKSAGARNASLKPFGNAVRLRLQRCNLPLYSCRMVESPTNA